MSVLFILMPVQTVFGRLFSTLRFVFHLLAFSPFATLTKGASCCFRAETAVLTDDRIRTMNEVISGIRVIKMYGWEKPFAALVNEVRR